MQSTFTRWLWCLGLSKSLNIRNRILSHCKLMYMFVLSSTSTVLRSLTKARNSLSFDRLKVTINRFSIPCLNSFTPSRNAHLPQQGIWQSWNSLCCKVERLLVSGKAEKIQKLFTKGSEILPLFAGAQGLGS